MALRTFVDSAGLEWDAFDVMPRADERRLYDRRTSSAGAAEERRERDRRLTIGGATRLRQGGEGWLCFERGTERRRLTPIPSDWASCPESRLDEYRQQARPARTTASFERPVQSPSGVARDS